MRRIHTKSAKRAWLSRFSCYSGLILIVIIQFGLIWYFLLFPKSCLDEKNVYNGFIQTTTTKPPIKLIKKSILKPNEYEYDIIQNYRPHFQLGKDITNYGTINKNILSGVISHIKINATTQETLQDICNGLNDCIGFTTHPTLGTFFYNKFAYPLQYNRNWNFYVKLSDINMNINIKTFTNKLIGYKYDTISSNKIERFKHINLSIPLIPRKFMSVEWNLGRVNNQIGPIESMIQYAIIYQRTIIFPFPHHRNHIIGLFNDYKESIWDLYKLSEVCDFLFEQEILINSIPNTLTNFILNNEIKTIKFPIDPNNYNFDTLNDIEMKYFNDVVNNSNHKLKNDPNFNLFELLHFRDYIIFDAQYNGWNNENLKIKSKCEIDRYIKDKISHNLLDSCRLIILDQSRFNPFYLDDFPIFNVMQFITPNKYIKEAVHHNIIRWFGDMNNYRIAIHRRIMKEGGHCPITGSPYVCRYYDRSLSKSTRFKK